MPVSQFIQVAIAASVLPVRLGLRAMLMDIGEIAVTAEAASIEALDLESIPDVIITTEKPNYMRSLSWRGTNPPAVLLLTSDPDAVSQLIDLQIGVWGVLPLDSSTDEISTAVHALTVGLWVGDPTLIQKLVTIEPAKLSSDFLDDEILTNREMEVLQGLSQGLANKQIGLALGISEHTVKFHVSAIYSKLDATNRTEAVRIGVQRGLVTL